MTSRSLDAVRAYVEAQTGGRAARSSGPVVASKVRSGLFVTISREAGAGGPEVAEALARILSDRKIGSELTPWMVFDRSLLETMAAEYRFPERVVRNLEEEQVSAVEGLAEDLLGVRPSATETVAKTNHTMSHLAWLGNAVILGRGGSIVTWGMRSGLHVRLVGSYWRRLQHLRDRYGLSASAAEDRIEKEDEGRRRYVAKYFRKDVADPVLYDLVINAHELGHEPAAQVIVEALRIHSSG